MDKDASPVPAAQLARGNRAHFPNEPPRMQREGHTLTVLRKVAGKWLPARDANLLRPPRAL